MVLIIDGSSEHGVQIWDKESISIWVHRKSHQILIVFSKKFYLICAYKKVITNTKVKGKKNILLPPYVYSHKLSFQPILYQKI